MLAAVASGLLVYAASPPRDLWWLVPLAFAGFAATVLRQRARAGFGYGLLFGLAYMLPLLGWLLDFLGPQFGPFPWLGVGLVEALFTGLAGAGMARVSRLPAAPVWMAAVFVLGELLRSHVPFGGFPWGLLAFTQTRGALLPFASLGGPTLVSAAVALVGAALAVLAVRLRESGLRGPRLLLPPIVLVLVPLLAGSALWTLVGTDPNAGTAKVAAVQGNAPNVGINLLSRDRDLRRNHVLATERLADQVQDGTAPRPDFVLLPEQVGSWGPSRTDPVLQSIAAQLGVPIIAGGFSEHADGSFHNSVVRWDPRSGATSEYVKQHLVPFAETIPMRAVARLVTPFVDRFQQDMIAGTEPGVMQAGPARVGIGLCFDVAYDDVFRGAARDGANLLAVPTNNAWYGRSEMSYQHLAMSQLRAVEHGRSVVVAATSGISAIIQPDGTISQRTQQFTAQDLQATVPLRSSQTAATALGAVPEWIAAVVALAALAATFRGAALPGSRRRAGADSERA
jgi:apolipoprotein N-acyltransferase